MMNLIWQIDLTRLTNPVVLRMLLRPLEPLSEDGLRESASNIWRPRPGRTNLHGRIFRMGIIGNNSCAPMSNALSQGSYPDLLTPGSPSRSPHKPVSTMICPNISGPAPQEYQRPPNMMMPNHPTPSSHCECLIPLSARASRAEILPFSKVR
jgi:hypothetical protein